MLRMWRWELHPPIPSISTFELTQNHELQLQQYRSRRPLGVRCSDWYQNEAGEFYFLFFKTVFVLAQFFGLGNSKCLTHNEQKRVKFTIWSTSDLPKKLDKILKIQNFSFRQLPSRKPLPVDVLSKNERIRNRLECARPIPDDLPQKLGIETLTKHWLLSVFF